MEPRAPTSPAMSTRSSTDLRYDDKHHEKDSLEMSELSDDLPTASDALLHDDVEAQKTETTTPAAPVEYTVSTSRKLIFLSVYFLLNLGLTLSNKAVMQRVSGRAMLMLEEMTSG